MRKVGLAAVLAALLMLGEIVWGPAAPVSAAVLPDSPTTVGQAIIGFQRGFLPAVSAGGRLAGLPVSRVSQNGSFVTVSAPSLGVVREALAAVPGVSYVEDNGLLHTDATPNDAKYGQQYGPQMMGFPAAWGAVGFGSTNVTVGFIDSGIQKTHEDLAGPRILQGHDYVNNDNNPDDTCGHGTHTAGILGATTNNSLGIAGEAQVNILEMKGLAKAFLGGCSGSYDGIAQGIMDAADQGAKIISMSIGGGASSTLQNAVNYAYNKGVILVAAAGNDGANNSIDYPGAYPNVIAVAALDSNKARASYSDGGPQLDISAPGSSVLSTYTGSNNATYSSLSGTSMATPGVAGALALALSCAPDGTTRDSVVNALYSTAEDLGPAGRDNSFGYGLARADRLVQQVCNGAPPVNQNPTAAFTSTPSGALGVSVDASTSSDPDGDTLTYAWDFGDSGTATGKTAAHTYASAGTYPIKLTVDDGHGGTNSLTQNFTPTGSTSDPDPSTPTITSGQTVNAFVDTSGPTLAFFKILVPSGTAQLQALTACSSSCPTDIALFTRFGSRPASEYDCKSNVAGNNQNCTTPNPAAGWWYIKVRPKTGAGTVQLTVTLS